MHLRKLTNDQSLNLNKIDNLNDYTKRIKELSDELEFEKNKNMQLETQLQANETDQKMGFNLNKKGT